MREWDGASGGERRRERVERCTTTKYDDAAVGTRLTPSKNDRRCLPCFLRASQFPTSLLLAVSSCWYLSRLPLSRYAGHPILDARAQRLPPGFRGILSFREYIREYTRCLDNWRSRSAGVSRFPGGTFTPPRPSTG